MSAQLLISVWLLTGQVAPATGFAPNVGVGRAQRSQVVEEPEEPETGLLAPSADVDLESTAESTPGVEFSRRGATRGNGLRFADGRDVEPARQSGHSAAIGDDGTLSEAPVERTMAQVLIKHGQTPPDDDAARIGGQGVSLYSVLDRVTDHGRRSKVIQAYWSLSAEVAAANWAAEEMEFLSSLSEANRGVEHVGLEAAQLDAFARWQAAKLSAVAAQYDLAEFAGLSADSPEALPLPRDLPLASSYQTKFERIFATRTPSSGVRRLATTIPLEFALIETRASAVSAGREAVKQLRHAYQQGGAELGQLLAAQDRLNQSQQAFLAAVSRYNESVTTYALSVAGHADNATLVAMLIPGPTGLPQVVATRAAGGSGRPTFEPSRVQPAGQFAPVLPAQSSQWNSAPRTIR